MTLTFKARQKLIYIYPNTETESRQNSLFTAAPVQMKSFNSYMFLLCLTTTLQVHLTGYRKNFLKTYKFSKVWRLAAEMKNKY